MFPLSCDYCVLCLFLAVPWVGHQSVIEAVPGHTHLLSDTYTEGPSIHVTLY